MAFIVKKKIHGKEYYYLNETKRQGKKVVSKCIAYLGKNKDEAERKAKTILKSGRKKKEGVKVTYFVHGTTTDNEKKISSGWHDVGLSELGIKQSNELKEKVKNKHFDIVFCSDLKRAVDSANITFGKKYKIIKDKRLRECNYGEFNSKSSKVIESLQEENISKRFPKGESYGDVKKRIEDFLDFLRQKYDGKQIAIVAHKAPQLALDVILKNKTWKQAFAEDWRKKGNWKPGWDYELKRKLDSIHKQKEFKLIKKEISVEDLAVFCKRRGFVYQSGEVYGGFAGFWDFGFLGRELKENIKKEWWKYHVYQRQDIIGIDGAIITHPKVWEASGHVDSFSDLFVVCKKCKKPSKIDKGELGKVKCECGGEYDVEKAKDFKLMFETEVGQGDRAYLRPETAQLMFTNFKSIYDSYRMKVPFGIAQIGKAFRNEIAPRDFLFRSREFEQMEIEYFIKNEMPCPYKIPDVEILIYSTEAQEAGREPERMKVGEALNKGIIKIDWHAYWLALEFLWFKNLGANPEKFRLRQHKKEELAHYSNDCWDLEYEFPFGWKELEGIADRGNFDLSQHEKVSGKELKIFDEESKQKFLPNVVAEPSLGVDRAFLVFLFDSYFYDEGRENIVLRLHPRLAPVKAAIFPIIKKANYEKIAEGIFKDLNKEWNVILDLSGSIGRRYARNDEIGTVACITVDEQSSKDYTCTIRDRDTTEQVRVKIADLREIVRRLIDGESFFKIGKLVYTRKK